MKREILPEAVVNCLPQELANRLDTIGAADGERIEELRLRNGYPMTALIAGEERALGGRAVCEDDLRELLERASQASAHTVLDQIKNGYVTIKGGHRIGLCGTVSCQNGNPSTLRYLYSAAVRVARSVAGQASALISQLTVNGQFVDTLILGPPGSGKTTLLRELIGALSNGEGAGPYRVAVADERGEIAALYHGVPQFAVGKQTDILDGCSKAVAIPILLRGMNPQVLAVDEVTHPADAAAIMEAVGCGTTLVATAHGNDVRDLERRPVYRQMLAERIFQRAVILQNLKGKRSASVEVMH